MERLKGEVLGRGEVQDLIASAWTAVRSMIVSAAEDERSELRLRVRASLLSLGARMATDPKLQAKVDRWIEGAAVYVVTTYRKEITSLITDTVVEAGTPSTRRRRSRPTSAVTCSSSGSTAQWWVRWPGC